WQKTFGGGDSDEANSIQQTTDGGYIVAGWTKSFHSGDEGVYKDVYILKLDSEGEIQWQKTFGGKDDDEANSIQQTTDGGYIVAGVTGSFGFGEQDAYILKVDVKGWLDTIPPDVKIISPRDGVELGGTIDINIDAKDNYELEKVTLYIDGKKVKEYTTGPYKYTWDSSKASEGAHTITVEAIDLSGNVGRKSIATAIIDRIKDVSWQKTFGGKNDDEANSIQQTIDGGYIVAGYKGGDVYILKLNSKGEIEWEKTFGGNAYDGASSIQQTTDDGYIVAGWTKSFGSGGYDVYILKLNSKGEAEWQKTFGGKGDDEANSIQQTTDGGYIVAGWTKSFGSGLEDIYILKLNSKGEVEWQKTFGGWND
ncbi:MAG TPA: Ig-like domain-containing protein, partial [Fervidobacterium sp.]|nr:Ig-like domain-containing protein [Fervidobacterium sp.]